MEQKNSIAHFIKYHNAVPIALGFIFLSMTATFAASEEARELVYDEEAVVRSVDNSYILSVNVEDYNLRMRITEIAEDGEYYYLTYEFDTIDVMDYVWKDVTVTKELRIAKALLGDGDLEVYAESELAQVRAAELARLKETQTLERAIGERQKIVATVYSGLVGKFIEPKVEQIPQYTVPALENDPLFVENPVPLVTWDANAEREESEVEEEENPEPTQEETPAPEEEGTPAEEDVPTEEVPVVAEPVEEPVTEEAVEEEAAPEAPVE
ncbi:hypothetical protein K2Y00_01340 [Patescibacteria group bacterium]|nr:hypothetical protein [Patescibacteria group bacterium]